MKKKLVSFCCAVALGLGLAAAASNAALAQNITNKKDKALSDRTVRVIMGYAFAGIPESLPNPKGEMVKVDRSDPKKFMIPLDDARRIIIQATISARADLCGLKDIQREHFESIMRHERGKKNAKGERKWTPYQMTYIDVLIATTTAVMTGSSAVGEDAKKADDPSEDIRANYKCTADERERARAAVEANIKQLAQAK